MHCVMSTTFVSVWGPGLALRGGTGSVAKAYTEMKAERGQVGGCRKIAIYTIVVA
jgi:hypothetical protein